MPSYAVESEKAAQHGSRDHDENDQVENTADDDDENDENDSDDETTPDFSADEYGEDFSNEVLCPEIVAERPKEHEGLSNIIIVDNIPKVDQSRFEKLKGAIAKVYSNCGTIRKAHYPLDSEGKTKGFAFFEFENEQLAAEAIKQTDGYRLDKSHTFAVCLMSDYERLTSVPPEPSVVGDLFSWLSEPHAVDQFAVQTDEPKRTIMYQNSLSQPTVIEERPKWTESIFVWSPKGTYLASFHEQGIALWGEKEFRQVLRFAHRGVNYIEFSPNERFLITLSSRPNINEAFIIWDVITGQKKRSFPIEATGTPGSAYFKWSFQDQYFAKQGADGLYIYDTKTFQLVDKRPFKIPLLVDFQWSTSENRIAYWTAEDGNIPARLVLAEIVNGNRLEEVRSKTLFNVTNCELCWQKRGDYLVVKVVRYTKKSGEKNNLKYSGLMYNFEIFHMREKNIPLDTLEVKEIIQSFAVEPNGHRLAVITGEGVKTNVTFYRMGQGSKSGKIELLKAFSYQVNRAVWAPTGQFVVLTAVKTSSSSGGSVVFLDTNEMIQMSKTEHPELTDVEWDPTGRYVTSYNNIHTSKRDFSFKIWTFQGNRVFERTIDRLVTFHWRPRPASLLTEEVIKEVRRKRSVWTAKFEQIDRMMLSGISAKQREQRKQLFDAFQALRNEHAKRLTYQKAERIKLRGGKDTDNIFDQLSANAHEESVEILLKTEEVEYKP